MSIQSQIVRIGDLKARFLSAGPDLEPTSDADPGDAATIVLLHGGGESALTWRWVIPSLAQRFRVLAPDLPGSGESDLVGGRAAARLFGSFVADFLDTVGVDRAVVVGHSLGGLAALHLALQARKRVSALALVASAGLGKEVNPIVNLLTLPGLGEWSALWSLTPPGQLQRLGLRAWCCFAQPAL